MAGNAQLRPSVGLALVGLMLERPSYGYELVMRFERVFGQPPWGWQVTQAAIYQALNRLERDGLIELVGDSGDRWMDSKQRRMRQNYRVTSRGAQAMREWLAAPMSSNPTREELLIRLHFGEASDEALRDMLRRHAEACLEELERIADAPGETRMQRLVKEERRLAVQARLSWVGLAPLLTHSHPANAGAASQRVVCTVENVSKRYRQGRREVLALRNVSLQLKAGEVVCITGIRGSGRTTLLRVVAGIEPPDAGSVQLLGRPLHEQPNALRRQIAFCNVRFLPLHGGDAWEQVMTPLLALPVSRDEARMRAHRALKHVGAADLAFTPPQEWIPSEAVRVAVARAIVRDPRLLIFDEPANGVDSVERDPLLVMLQRIARESGIAMLLTAGDAASVPGADHVLRLSDGELLGRAAPTAAEVVELRRPTSESSR